MPIRFALALIATLFAAFPALASPSCMTKHEARARYQTSWISWRTEHHCWYAGHPSHAARHAKRSAQVARGSLPSGESDRAVTHGSAGADTVSIWPDPPTDYSWVDRWPNQRVGEPERWLFDLVEFGSK